MGDRKDYGPSCPHLIFAKVQLLGKGAEARDVTQEVAGPTPIKLRFSFIPLVDKLVQAHLHGTPLRPNAEDMRFALEAAIGLKQSAAADHQPIPLPIADRSACIHLHPYRALGGDIAGYNSLYPKYQAPSFAMHLRNGYITKPKHEEGLRQSQNPS